MSGERKEVKMNIFFLDYNPELCAMYHCDKHVIKMLVEYCQLLSIANRSCGLDEGYALTHFNHPSAKWVRESLDNWMYVRELSVWLNKEYRYRYEKSYNHKSFDVTETLSVPPLPSRGLTKVALAMPVEYKKYDSAVECYRQYYKGEKATIATWRKRGKPYWWFY